MLFHFPSDAQGRKFVISLESDKLEVAYTSSEHFISDDASENVLWTF